MTGRQTTTWNPESLPLTAWRTPSTASPEHRGLAVPTCAIRHMMMRLGHQGLGAEAGSTFHNHWHVHCSMRPPMLLWMGPL